jgi:hypothetical protein
MQAQRYWPMGGTPRQRAQLDSLRRDVERLRLGHRYTGSNLEISQRSPILSIVTRTLDAVSVGAS